MEDPKKTVSYRIGEYARKMGVTPDFLKYYEQAGLLQADVRENGYRYFPFHQSGKILECMRLKGYGFSVRQMQEMFGSGMDDAQSMMAEQVRELEQKVAFQQRVIQEYRQFAHWLDRMEGKTTDWSVEWGEETWFLPHTDRRTFLSDPRIYELLKYWIAQMPMVKSCMEIPDPGRDGAFCPETDRYFWGMSIPRAYAEEVGLPVNGAVKLLPRRKLFQFCFNGGTSGAFPYQAAVRQLKALGLSPSGNSYVTMYMYANMKTTPERCGVISIPITNQ